MGYMWRHPAKTIEQWMSVVSVCTTRCRYVVRRRRRPSSTPVPASRPPCRRLGERRRGCRSPTGWRASRCSGTPSSSTGQGAVARRMRPGCSDRTWWRLASCSPGIRRRSSAARRRPSSGRRRTHRPRPPQQSAAARRSYDVPHTDWWGWALDSWTSVAVIISVSFKQRSHHIAHLISSDLISSRFSDKPRLGKMGPQAPKPVTQKLWNIFRTFKNAFVRNYTSDVLCIGT